MAEDAPPDVAGLGKAFAEFALLPDLLQVHQAENGTAEAWISVLRKSGFNDGHVSPGDLPRMGAGGLAEFMARDALRMCERLRLVDGEALTEAGRRVAEVGEVPILERHSEVERAAAAVVGEQIRRHYVGADGLELVPLMQEASARLAAEELPGWAAARGLLLVEFETLLHWGLADAERARGLPEELAAIRHEVIGRLEGGGLAGPDGDPGMFSDAMTFWHEEQPELALTSSLSLTELRVTAMAMAWSGLLAEEFAEFEISFLAPAAVVA